MATIQVKFFFPPHGHSSMQEITGISDEDALWFTNNNIKLSMEELQTGAKVIYADYGNPDEEALVVSMSKPCIEMMSELKKQTELALARYKLEVGDNASPTD